MAVTAEESSGSSKAGSGRTEEEMAAARPAVEGSGTEGSSRTERRGVQRRKWEAFSFATGSTSRRGAAGPSRARAAEDGTGRCLRTTVMRRSRTASIAWKFMPRKTTTKMPQEVRKMLVKKYVLKGQ
jgi:hypothetical protein